MTGMLQRFGPVVSAAIPQIFAVLFRPPFRLCDARPHPRARAGEGTDCVPTCGVARRIEFRRVDWTGVSTITRESPTECNVGSRHGLLMAGVFTQWGPRGGTAGLNGGGCRKGVTQRKLRAVPPQTPTAGPPLKEGPHVLYFTMVAQWY